MVRGESGLDPESSKERKFPGPIRSSQTTGRVLLQLSLLGASWPGREKAWYDGNRSPQVSPKCHAAGVA